jgi:hypothetical protein
MADNEYSVSGLEVRHVPDYSMEQGPDGNRQRVELPGHHVVGAVVNGAFVPLAKIGTARLQKHVERAASSGQEQDNTMTGPTVQPQQVGTGTLESDQTNG